MCEFNELIFSEKIYIGGAPKHLLQNSAKALNDRILRIRAKQIEKIHNTDFKYYCSVCLIIRDENEYLEEWLRWHLLQGVEHFYIYDHGSKYPVKDFVLQLGADVSEKITVIDWSGKHEDAQPNAYNDCLKKFSTESRWIGFIDTDEQVRVNTRQTLPELLKEFEDYAALFVCWLIYDANGQVKKTNEPLRKRFTHVNFSDEYSSRMGKVFVQPMLMREMVIHNGSPAVGFEVVNEHKKKIAPYSLVCDKPSYDFICVDHYYTKSYEEWINKINRGCGHSKYQRKYDEFFGFNKDLEYCRENIVFKQKYNN